MYAELNEYLNDCPGRQVDTVLAKCKLHVLLHCVNYMLHSVNYIVCYNVNYTECTASYIVFVLHSIWCTLCAYIRKS